MKELGWALLAYASNLYQYGRFRSPNIDLPTGQAGTKVLGKCQISAVLLGRPFGAYGCTGLLRHVARLRSGIQGKAP